VRQLREAIPGEIYGVGLIDADYIGFIVWAIAQQVQRAPLHALHPPHLKALIDAHDNQGTRRMGDFGGAALRPSVGGPLGPGGAVDDRDTR